MADERLLEAINIVSNGAAICFVGAGFSPDALDTEGRSVPSVAQLTEEIQQLAGIDPSEGGSLSDLAEFCDANAELSPKLRALMVRRLTKTVPSASQRKLLSAPWRAIFTTNFDDIIEQALPSGGFQAITPGTDVKVITTDKLPIYYLHGRALDLVESRSDPSLILSETNYLELRDRNVNLHAAFLNELHCANLVFFVGYSLRDMDIARRVFSVSDALRSKSIVVCGSTEGQVARSRLAKFGEVYPVGLQGLAAKLPDNFGARVRPSAEKLAFVVRSEREPAKPEVVRDDIDRLIIGGEFDYSAFAAQMQSDDTNNIYCVPRSAKLEELFQAASAGMNRFVVSADIGNGKSTFLDQIAYTAHGRGFEVFRVTSQLPEMFNELEVLLARPQLQMFIVDDLVRNRKAAEFIGARLSKLGVLVCATRDAFEGDAYGELNLGGAHREIDIDVLSSEEITAWETLLERWGLWEDRIALNPQTRLEFLKKQCGSENRSIVVSVFRSSQIAQKIENIVSYFLKTRPQHLRAFIAILICSLCQKHVDWDRVVQWLDIDEHELRNDLTQQAVFNFMSGRREWYKFTSAQLADHIFRKFDFDDNDLVDVYTKIVRETAYSANDWRSGFDSKENLKELMKFRFLTRVFGDRAGAQASIAAIYARLSSVQRIRDNDQFWLQYAMSCMENENTQDAEAYINTALGIAKKKGLNYSDYQIRDQRARVLILKNSKAGKLDRVELETAISDLSAALSAGDAIEHIHPLRAAPYILQLVDEKIDDMDGPVRAKLLSLIEAMQDTMKTKRLIKTKRGEEEKLRKDLLKAALVLKNA